MKTQQEYFQEHANEAGELSPEHTAVMLTLPQGETVYVPTEGGEPEPTATPAPTPAPQPDPEPTPAPTPAPDADLDPAKTVILSKDGVHTIGFEKLVEAREGEKTAKARADAAEAEATRLREENARLTAQAPAATPAPSTAPKAGDDVDFGDYSDAALKKGIEEMVQLKVAAAVNEKLTPIEQQRAKDATTKHFETILTAHPNLDAMLESRELETWITSKPSFVQQALRGVLSGGTADQVVELFDTYKAEAKPGTAAAPPPQPTAAPVAEDPAVKAAKAIEAAKNKPPSSLSEIPGATTQHDEAGAMLEMTPTALMNKLMGKTPEQIEALVNRAL